MSRRRLSDDESTLWTVVTRSIKPLRPRARPVLAPPAANAVIATKPSARAKPTTVTPPAVARKTPPAAPPLAPLERRFRQRLKRDSEAIEDRIDLHGRTQAQAHDALLRFLRMSQSHGTRTVLVITGKGARGVGDGFGERGVLKRQVPMWLRLPEFRGFVVGFEDASVRHGGEGALYVRLRKPRGE